MMQTVTLEQEAEAGGCPSLSLFNQRPVGGETRATDPSQMKDGKPPRPLAALLPLRLPMAVLHLFTNMVFTNME